MKMTGHRTPHETDAQGNTMTNKLTIKNSNKVKE